MSINERPFVMKSGFTLIEMLIVISVIAVALSWATPSISELIKNNRVTSQNNELVAMLSFAKTVAIRNNRTVTVVLGTNAQGWTGLVEDPTSDEDVAGCGPGVLRCSDSTDVLMNSGAVTLLFNSRGYLREADEPWTSETIFLQHNNCSGERQRRRIDIMPTGQVSSCDLPCGSSAACPL